ncbi:hypothetical protein Tco_0895324 [Tanacetum coccineum]|uniref:Uncharacterized protein n=1 Tax=Tanacetum coccineum TaxID=301880 RepID=A0ABQ5CFT8_9ASTR
MSASNQQTLAESGASERPPMLEKERIPNDIYNFEDACKNAQQMLERIRRLMHGFEKIEQHRHSRLADEFDKFVTVEGESLSFVYEWLTTLNANIKEIEFDHLFDTLSQYEPHVNASRVKKATRIHDPLALIAHSNVHSSHSHASPSYSHSPQPYYVPHPSSVIDYEDDYQGEIQGNAQNQAVIQDGRVDIQRKNVDYAGNGHYARDCPQPKVRDENHFREQMLLTMKDEAGGNLNVEENDFMLDNAYGDDTLEELNAVVIMMACIQPAYDKANAKPKSDAENISEPCDIESLIYNVQKDAKNQQRVNNELEKPKAMLKKELETCKEWVKTLEKKPFQSLNYKEPYEELEREIPGLGYQNPKHLKKAITEQPKIYDGERLQSTKLIIDSPDSEETLKDAKESRLKMKDKIIQLNYEKLNALYETFIPQQEIPIKQTYFSTPSTSNVPSE